MLADSRRLIVALDFDNITAALGLVEKLDPQHCRLKVGKEMFTHFGPDFVRQLQQRGFEIFLDLKFHDIPNTVAKACAAAADLGVWMINCHATGGPAMLTAAKQAIEPLGKDAPLLTAVTVLTSMNEEQMIATGVNMSIADRVVLLAKLSEGCGLDGIVCSAQEAKQLRQEISPEFLLVTPGIRPPGAAANDQQRIMTPDNALADGASYLVIGRPITQAADPLKSLYEISESIESALTN